MAKVNILYVKFEESGKLCPYLSQDTNINQGTFVVCSTDKGIELGKVMKKEDCQKEEDMKTIMRLATKADIERYESLKQKSLEDLAICKNIVQKLGLDMKLLEARCTLDKAREIFYYSAQERVDFRELVKELAATLKIRIEMKQIGPRDEMKSYDTFGVCGRELCCKSFLKDFDSVTIKDAKTQGMQINMQRLTGFCGKLKCCIKYEEEAYKELLNGMPKINEVVEYEGKNVKVAGQDILNRRLKLKLEDEEEEQPSYIMVDVNEVKRKEE